MLDIAGADATEAFEDVGHSDEARDILPKLFVGDLKRLVSSIQYRTLHFDNCGKLSLSPLFLDKNYILTAPSTSPVTKSQRLTIQTPRLNPLVGVASRSTPSLLSAA